METVKHTRFKRALWGFNPSQVQKEIISMHDSHQESTLQYQTLLEQLQMELEGLTAQSATLTEQLQQMQEKEHLLAELLLTAQGQASQIINAAQAEADTIVINAQQEIERKRVLLQRIDQEQNLFMDDFRSLFYRLQHNCSLLLNPMPQVDTYQPFIPGNLCNIGKGGPEH